eukprot:6536095-Prymnesium_polylepis.1
MFFDAPSRRSYPYGHESFFAPRRQPPSPPHHSPPDDDDDDDVEPALQLLLGDDYTARLECEARMHDVNASIKGHVLTITGGVILPRRVLDFVVVQRS